MLKTRADKEKILESLKQNLEDSKGVVFVDYKGLKVKDTEELRKSLREKSIKFNVTKNTLLRLALIDKKVKINDEILDKPLAIALSFTDEVSAARGIAEFQKTHEDLEIVGGILEDKFISDSEVKALALLPSREQLYAQILGLMSSGKRNMVSVLQANLSGVIRLLQARAESN